MLWGGSLSQWGESTAGSAFPPIQPNDVTGGGAVAVATIRRSSRSAKPTIGSLERAEELPSPAASPAHFSVAWPRSRDFKRGCADVRERKGWNHSKELDSPATSRGAAPGQTLVRAECRH